MPTSACLLKFAMHCPRPHRARAAGARMLWLLFHGANAPVQAARAPRGPLVICPHGALQRLRLAQRLRGGQILPLPMRHPTPEQNVGST
eukprot:8599708-Pyramimonas_sp.AAC.1